MGPDIRIGDICRQDPGCELKHPVSHPRPSFWSIELSQTVRGWIWRSLWDDVEFPITEKRGSAARDAQLSGGSFATWGVKTP